MAMQSVAEQNSQALVPGPTLGKKAAPARPSSALSGVFGFGLAVVLIAFVGLGGWAAVAPLASAIPAPAVLSVKGERKQIQHLEGGIVEKILVEEGEHVEKDQLLVLLDPIQAGATTSRIRLQIDQQLAITARLKAELADAPEVEFPDELLSRADDPQVMQIIATEKDQFEARRESFNGQISILEQRITQLQDQIRGLQVQRQSRLDQLKIFADEVVGLRELYEKGYTPRTQVLAVERAMESLKGARGSDDAEIAQVRNSIGESETQIISLKQRFREDAVSQLRENQANIADLRARMIVAQDILRRVEIRAPQSGIAQNVKTHTVGGVVRAGEVLMEIAPQNEELLVEAKVSPSDIDGVTIGQEAEVRFSALNLRETPIIIGTVRSVSGDRLIDETNRQPYFLARVEVSPEERAKLGDGARLSAGMPAEVLINTGERTALQYLLKPLTDALARGLTEE
jgi:HlyD family type I secretion membrane fusion protein